MVKFSLRRFSIYFGFSFSSFWSFLRWYQRHSGLKVSMFTLHCQSWEFDSCICPVCVKFILWVLHFPSPVQRHGLRLIGISKFSKLWTGVTVTVTCDKLAPCPQCHLPCIPSPLLPTYILQAPCDPTVCTISATKKKKDGWHGKAFSMKNYVFNYFSNMISCVFSL